MYAQADLRLSGRTYHIVGNLMRRLIYLMTLAHSFNQHPRQRDYDLLYNHDGRQYLFLKAVLFTGRINRFCLLCSFKMKPKYFLQLILADTSQTFIINEADGKFCAVFRHLQGIQGLMFPINLDNSQETSNLILIHKLIIFDVFFPSKCRLLQVNVKLDGWSLSNLVIFGVGMNEYKSTEDMPINLYDVYTNIKNNRKKDMKIMKKNDFPVIMKRNNHSVII